MDNDNDNHSMDNDTWYFYLYIAEYETGSFPPSFLILQAFLRLLVHRTVLLAFLILSQKKSSIPM